MELAATESAVPTAASPVIQSEAVLNSPICVDSASPAELLGEEQCLSSKEDELEGIKKVLEGLTAAEKSKLTDLTMPVRHLRACKGKVKKTIKSIQDTLKWREDFQVQRLLDSVNSDSDVDDDAEFRSMLELEHETGKIQVRGYTKEGRSIVFMDNSRNNTSSELDNMRQLTYNIEKAIACTRRKSMEVTGKCLEKHCLLVDFANFSLSNAPSMKASKHTLEILQNRYPERLHRIFMINAPTSFRIFWNLVKPFIDPVTKKKALFCNEDSEDMKSFRSEISEHYLRELETCMGEGSEQFRSKEYLSLPLNVCYNEST